MFARIVRRVHVGLTVEADAFGFKAILIIVWGLGFKVLGSSKVYMLYSDGVLPPGEQKSRM